MTRSLLLSITLAIAFTSCRKTSRPLAPPETPTLPMPSITLTIHTMLSHSRDSTMHAQDTTTDFNIRDTIHGLIETENVPDSSVLVGRWYYMKTGQQIAQSSALLSNGTNLSHFDLTNENPWPLGQYKLMVLIDSVLRDSAQFTVENKR